MEYIVGLIALAAVIYLVTRKKEEAVVEAAPYKVETPETKVEAVNAQPVVAEVKPAKKPAAKKAPAKKPAAKKAPAKKAAPKKQKA